MTSLGAPLEVTFDVADERLARAAWSRLAEPGDKYLAETVAATGPSEALRRLLSRREVRMAAYEPRLRGLDPVRDLALAAKAGIRLLCPGDDEWPVSLHDLPQPPLALWARGPAHLAEDTHRSVSVVGARAATPYGEGVAGDLAAGLCERGFTVISGLAYGIDGAAHRGALAAGGPSIAVVAGGVERAYPVGHDLLLGRLVEEGLVVSEVPPGSAPTRLRFLQRNRLIAALGRATVVVEAALRSGALNTARTADDLCRPVGVVPGPVTSMTSAGCHDLVRAGRATLVTDAAECADLAGRIGDDAVGHRSGPDAEWDGLDETCRRVLDALPLRSARPTERIAATAGLDVATTQSGLGQLELLGLAGRGPAGWSRARPGRR